MQRKFIVPASVVLSLSAFAGAFAQTAPESGLSAWAVGLGAVTRTNLYVGESPNTTLVPLIGYEGEHFFWRGIHGGYHLHNAGTFKLDVTVGARLNSMKKDDFGASQLAAKGIDRNRLDDRNSGVDMGFSGSFKGEMGVIELALKADVSGASKGFESSAKYAYPLHWGSTLITPNIAISHYSKELANYYYGTHDEEVARGVVNYKPGNTSIVRVGVDLVQPFGDKWVFMGSLFHSALPSEITNSPLVDKDKTGVTSGFIGVSRRF